MSTWASGTAIDWSTTEFSAFAVIDPFLKQTHPMPKLSRQ
jgi:hypothetical protein